MKSVVDVIVRKWKSVKFTVCVSNMF